MSDDGSHEILISPTVSVPEIQKIRQKLKDNNGWNKIMEDEAKKFQQKAWSYKYMHAKSSHRFNKFDMWIAIMLICLNILAANTSIFGQSTTVTGVANMSAALLVGIKQTAKFPQLAQRHKAATNEFSKLSNGIRLKLELYRRDRPPAREYIEKLTASYDNLLMKYPNIPTVIQDKFNKSFQHYSFSKPDIITDGIDMVEFEIADEAIDRGSGANRGIFTKLTSPTKNKTVIPMITQNITTPHEESDISEVSTEPDEEDKKHQYELRRFLDAFKTKKGEP